jgi:hypothetical protein
MLSVPPAESVEVVKYAFPPLNADVPSVFFPWRNVTVSPSGGVGVTVAVNVTACPYVEGFKEDEIVVVVLVNATLRLEAATSKSAIMGTFIRIWPPSYEKPQLTLGTKSGISEGPILRGEPDPDIETGTTPTVASKDTVSIAKVKIKLEKPKQPRTVVNQGFWRSA